MARKYSRGASKDVEREMHQYKRGKLKSGRGGKGGKVKSRKQAIAIGLSEARREGKKVPPKKKKSSKGRKRSSGRRKKSSTSRRGHSRRRSRRTSHSRRRSHSR